MLLFEDLKVDVAIPIDLEYHFGLMEKQLKKLAELADLTPPGPIKTQVNDLIRRLQLELTFLRHGVGVHLSAAVGQQERDNPSDGVPPRSTGESNGGAV